MIGLTTTIPLEILHAAGTPAVDLNNLFITDPAPHALIDAAERDGFPRNCCSWIKGLYGTALREGVSEMIAVSEGDCSNTKALMEVLQLKGIKAYHFSFPSEQTEAAMAAELDRLAAHVGAGQERIQQSWKRLNRIRNRVHEIDRLTWQTDQVTGGENHLYQVCTSDMNGDADAFLQQVEQFLLTAQAREPLPQKLRLGYMGVPPICNDLYSQLEDQGARVVFNEVQRQFSMPQACTTLAQQYTRYTYPYSIHGRLADIQQQIETRHIHGMIHYVQSFCYRQIEDIVVRQTLPIPILTLEGDQPGPLDARNRIRIESFIEMLKARYNL